MYTALRDRVRAAHLDERFPLAAARGGYIHLRRAALALDGLGSAPVEGSAVPWLIREHEALFHELAAAGHLRDRLPDVRVGRPVEGPSPCGVDEADLWRALRFPGTWYGEVDRDEAMSSLRIGATELQRLQQPLDLAGAVILAPRKGSAIS
jgi:hypothetical protein